MVSPSTPLLPRYPELKKRKRKGLLVNPPKKVWLRLEAMASLLIHHKSRPPPRPQAHGRSCHQHHTTIGIPAKNSHWDEIPSSATADARISFKGIILVGLGWEGSGIGGCVHAEQEVNAGI